MKKILILGSTGMLGMTVSKLLISELTNSEIYLTYTSEDKINILKKKLHMTDSSKLIKFNILKDNIFDLPNDFDIVINCIGIIKPFIDEQNSSSLERSIIVNSKFPFDISNHFNSSSIIQIATDCVFSGITGNYDEESSHDPIDVYGKTKSLGEVISDNFFNLRCSIIGHELSSSNSLLEWFLSQKKNSNINGFVNHTWNGLTTLTYSKLLLSIIKNKINIPNKIHLIPKNKVNKFQLIQIFRKYSNRDDIKVNEFYANVDCHRTLKTLYQDINNEIWEKSIYQKLLTIEEMVSEIL